MQGHLKCRLSTMGRTQVQLGYNRLKEAQEDVNGDARPDLWSTSTTDGKIESSEENDVE